MVNYLTALITVDLIEDHKLVRDLYKSYVVVCSLFLYRSNSLALYVVISSLTLRGFLILNKSSVITVFSGELLDLVSSVSRILVTADNLCTDSNEIVCSKEEAINLSAVAIGNNVDSVAKDF